MTLILDQIEQVFILAVAALAVAALWYGGVKKQTGVALGIVAVILVATGIWGFVYLFQSGAAAAVSARLASFVTSLITG